MRPYDKSVADIMDCCEEIQDEIESLRARVDSLEKDILEGEAEEARLEGEIVKYKSMVDDAEKEIERLKAERTNP
jgi:predicted  nucleic acid-binding Zn-ribbon protein